MHSDSCARGNQVKLDIITILQSSCAALNVLRAGTQIDPRNITRCEICVKLSGAREVESE